MFELLWALILLILSPFILLYRWISISFNFKRYTAFANHWENQCKEANIEFGKYRKASHFFSDEEKLKFIEKYRSLYEEIKQTDIENYIKIETKSDFEKLYFAKRLRDKYEALRKRLLPISDFAFGFAK